MSTNQLSLSLAKPCRKIVTFSLHSAPSTRTSHRAATAQRPRAVAPLHSPLVRDFLPDLFSAAWLPVRVSSCRSHVHRGKEGEGGGDETRKASGNIVTMQPNQIEFEPQWDLIFFHFRWQEQHRPAM